MTVSPPVDVLGPEFTDVHLLHAGSRSLVYAARDATTRREVAVKTVPQGTPAWLRDLVDREAVTLARVGAHPHVVTLYHRTQLGDGRTALVLERCHGSLADVLHEDPDTAGLAARQTVAVGIKLAGALETVHAAGLVHGTVHPGTVLRTEWAEPVLSGFADAVPLGAEQPALQVTTVHTAPELLQGDAAGPASDVYGLAATLYHLLAGHSAFREYAGESPAAVVVRVLSGGVRPLVAPGIPLALSDLLAWAMAGDPRDRPPTPAWLGEELGRLESAQGWPRTHMVR